MFDLQIGDLAPQFSLPSTAGKPVDLTELRGKWVVLYFYPKDDTPGCTTEACNFRDALNELEKLGVIVLGVSMDPPESHEKFQKKYKLNFSLLSDMEQKVTESYGVLREKQGLLGPAKKFTARSTFIIDPEGRIAKIFTDVKPDKHIPEVLVYLQTVAKGWMF